MDNEENDDLSQDDVQEVTLPSKTYKIVGNKVVGTTDGLDAMQQAINKILATERFVYPIYSENYGNDLSDLIGKDYDYIKADIERVISEALKADDRVIDVDIDSITRLSDSIYVTGTAHTIFGDVDVESEVDDD